MSSLRVGIDALNTWYLNGNSVYTKNLVLALSRLGRDIDLHLFTRRRRGERVRASIGAASNVRYRPCLLHPLTLGPLFEDLIPRVNDLIIRGAARRLDLFHCTNPANYPLWAPRVVLTLLDLIALRKENWVSEGSKRYYRRHIGRIVDSALAITTISAHTKKDLAEHFPEAVGKTTVIHIAGNPIYRKTEADLGVLDKYGLSGDRPFLLYVGQYQPRKNIVSMLRAFSLLDKDIRREYRFVLAGSKMKEHMYVEIKREMNSMEQDMDLLSLVSVPDEDLLHLYNAAALFVFIPLYEGFGVPVVEAMACGCPVLASSATSIPEVAGDAALLVNPNSIEEIASAMDRLLRDQELRERLAKRGLERSRKFSWRKTALETLALYESLI